MISKKKRYGYNDWWSGKIHLGYSPSYFNEGQEFVAGVIWKDIRNASIPKIKNKQKEIFETEVQLLFEKFKSTFLERYEKSQMKEVFLSDEIEECRTLMSGQISDGEFTHSNQWIGFYNTLDLHHIQHYIDVVIKKGITKDYDYIHSPKFPYQEKSKIPCEIYAQTLWDYFCWLEEFRTKTKQEDTAQSQPDLRKEESPNNKDQHREFNNLIFPNEKSSQIFEALLKEFEIEIKTMSLAHLSFIYWSMKRDKYLNKIITPTFFREFLAEEPYKIVLVKLKTLDDCDTPLKRRVYKACVNQLDGEKANT
jgi:hypothetical protein